MDTNDKIARASLHIEVADRVRDMIYDRSLPPGHRIDELDLSAKLGTSRTPLREALKVLANEGLVRLAPGRGAYVTEMTAAEVDALFPVLALIEGRATSEAVRRLNLADGRRLNALHQKMEDRCAAGDIGGFHQATDDLHRQLLAIASNPWLMRIQQDLHRFLKLARSRMPVNQNRILQTLAEHRTLIKAITRNDPEGAEQVMQHHVLAQQRHFRQTLVQLQAAEAERVANQAAQSSSGEPARQPLATPAAATAGNAPAVAAAGPANAPLATAPTSAVTDGRAPIESIGV